MGTRPEAIKMAPVVGELRRRGGEFEPLVVTTAQHRGLLDQTLSGFDIKPDVDLNLMQQNQSLSDFASKSLQALSNLFSELRPQAILIQGDTTTVMTAALAAFYNDLSVGHVEAGLRSFDRRNPFPEEINRRIASCLVDMHFAPTARARRNLLNEGTPEDDIFVTGNTIVDALKAIPLEGEFENEKLNRLDFDGKRLLLVTAHRRENHGEPLRSICRGLRMIVERFDDVEIVYPVHPNPNVMSVADEELARVNRVHLVEPASYGDLLKLMDRCHLILTDSGGMQEEAPSLHKPVLVLRKVTERPEVVEAGAGRIVGTDSARILEAASSLLADPREYRKMSEAENPFGDGLAAQRIVEVLAQRFGDR
jgi:UDP-N-acetylglucosamine 2-epimerase (non-hydrolysing)